MAVEITGPTEGWKEGWNGGGEGGLGGVGGKTGVGGLGGVGVGGVGGVGGGGGGGGVEERAGPLAKTVTPEAMTLPLGSILITAPLAVRVEPETLIEPVVPGATRLMVPPP